MNSKSNKHVYNQQQQKIIHKNHVVLSPNIFRTPSPSDSGISLENSPSSETQKNIITTSQKTQSTFRVPQLPKNNILNLCDLCPKNNECKCKTVEIGFQAKSRRDDPRLRIKANSKKHHQNFSSLNPKNLMDRRLIKKASSIYSFKPKTPVIPKLCRMSIQKLREAKKLKIHNQFKNQQNASKMQDCSYVAESYQQYLENRIHLDNHYKNSFSTK
jgi:hypothetical protein